MIKLQNPKIKIIIFMLVLFLISANMAWLNPFPEKEAYKIHPKIPFLWQYNLASGVEILSAAYFPETYRTYKDRINRPVYPLLVKTIGTIIGFVLLPIIKLSALESAGIAYILLKLFIYILGALLMYEILKRYISEKASLLAIFLCFSHWHMIEYFTTFQTTELQVITPIIILFMFLKLMESYSIKKNIGFSLIIGIIFLAKQNFAVYLALILLGLIKKEWKKVLLSIVSQSIPLIIYLIFLKIIKVPYYNHEAEMYRQGVWVVDLFHQNPLLSIKQVCDSFYKLILHTGAYFSVWGFIAAYALASWKDIKLNKNHLLFFTLFFISTWAQVFAANRYFDYMIADFAFIVFGLAAFSFLRFLSIFKDNYSKLILISVISLWLLVNVFHFINFPYIHPYDQKARDTKVMNQRMDMVENPDEYSEEDKAKAKGGNLINKGK